MFVQLFGRYLVKENAISSEAYEKIVEKMASVRAKLGVIAIAEGMITKEQAEEINKLQTQRDERFGSIAVSEGFLTEEQLETVLNKQGSPYIKFIQLLSEDAGLDIAKADEYLKAFQKEQGFDDSEIESLKNDDIDALVPIFAYSSKPYVTNIAALALRMITRFVSTDFYIGKLEHIQQFQYRNFAGQKLHGDDDVCIGFGTKNDNTAFIDIAAGYSKSKIEKFGVEVYDAVGEFVNCISGLFATYASKKNETFEIMPQFAYENQMAKGNAYVLPIYIENNEVYLYIAVDNEVEIGSMPVLHKMRAKEGSTASENSKGTVVIVDDSGMSRKILRDILEEEGYTVVAEATDGLEGVLAYKQYMPDIITLDITMPNLDGTGALKQIKEYDDDAKVIMITAAGQQNKVIEALKIGAEKFVTKPYDKEDIIKSINEMME